MKIAAVVVTYNPDPSRLYENIKAFADYVDCILIQRNSSATFEYLSEWEYKITYLGTGENEFIAKPLNDAIDYCIMNDYDYLLTMDQDSIWVNFSEFISLVCKQDHNNRVAIYAPNCNAQFKDKSVQFHDIEWVIQSGMLIDVQIAKTLGGFREDYKIYGVDEEFCYWIRINGYKTRVFTHCELKQEFGRITKTVFGFETLNYSPVVRYFLIRNMIWMKREFRDSTTIKRICAVLYYNFIGILLGESNKMRKVFMLVKGVFHGLFMAIKNERSE